MTKSHKTNHCPLCQNGVLHEETREITRKYKGVEFKILQPGQYCDKCNDGIILSKHRRAIQKEIQKQKSQIDGLLTPEKIKDCRKKLGLKQKEASDIFGGGINAFSRYERGEIGVSRPLSILLCILADHPNLLKQYSTLPSSQIKYMQK